MKKVVYFLVIILLLVGNIQSVYSDGCLIAPPQKVAYETDQKAVIFYDEGIEHLVLSITYQGNANDFAWIVPTPTQPQVEKSSDYLFQNLDDLTRPNDRVYPQPLSYNEKMAGADAEQGVTVLETKKIEYYDINVLAATDKEALYQWLLENDYHFPQAGKYIADEYIQKGWTFTAIKIDDDRVSSLTKQQLVSGHAVPLGLTFSTPKIVYPLKISSIAGIEDTAPQREVTYLSGAEGKGIKLDIDRILATDNVVESLDMDEGEISFYLKKTEDASAVGEIISISQSLNKQYGLSIKNERADSFEFQYKDKEDTKTWRVNLGSDFKKNEWQKYRFTWKKDKNNLDKIEISFFIGSQKRQMTPVVTSTFNNVEEKDITDKAKVVIGGEQLNYATNLDIAIPADFETYQYKPHSYINYRNQDLFIDKVRVVSQSKNIFKADFEDNLEIKLVNNKQDYLRVFQKENSSYVDYPTISRPTQMGILLYIFSDKKQELGRFNTQYAGWIKRDEIKNLATLTGGDPWVEPSKSKYFLTRLYRNMPIAEMTEDLYPTASVDQTAINAPVASSSSKLIWLYLLVGFSVVVTAGVVILFIRNEKLRKATPRGRQKH